LVSSDLDYENDSALYFSVIKKTLGAYGWTTDLHDDFCLLELQPILIVDLIGVQSG